MARIVLRRCGACTDTITDDSFLVNTFRCGGDRTYDFVFDEDE